MQCMSDSDDSMRCAVGTIWYREDGDVLGQVSNSGLLQLVHGNQLPVGMYYLARVYRWVGDAAIVRLLVSL
jgi:hypothetical protein